VALVKGAPKIRGCRPGVWRWGVGCLPGKDADAYTATYTGVDLV